MSIDIHSREDGSDDRNLRVICEEIVEDDGFSDRAQSMAQTLLEGIKEGRIDVN
ncbi:hypothetical protein [Halolamina rubra]|uniref:hypothetical protein n=1 Tax=Halolamina rubra TaxID=1380430 RepID=UPI0012ABEB47|nr:hypothetical protein [Halolamina rubra]